MNKLDLVSQKRILELFNYNPHTGLVTRKTTIGGNSVKKIVGTRNSSGYLRVRIDKKLYYLHRVVWVYMYGDGSLKGKEIDHIDRNKLNNRISNLRLVDRCANNRNIGLRKTNTSGFNGISFHKRRKKWLARIGANNRKIEIGYYEKIEDAILARKEAERIFWKD